MEIRDAAKVFIKNKKNGKYLFFLRDNKPTIPDPNTYGLLGGAIEDGEQPFETLKRELQEEINIDVYDIEKLGSKIVTRIINDGRDTKVKSCIFFVFLAKIDATLDELILDEGQKLEYFTIEEALNQKNLQPAVREIIRENREKLI
jgi:8-oxo-dGTP diphosphatase